MEELKKDIEKILLYEKEKNEICKKIREIEEKIVENYEDYKEMEKLTKENEKNEFSKEKNEIILNILKNNFIVDIMEKFLKEEIEKILKCYKNIGEKRAAEIKEKIKKLLFEKMPFLKANIYFSFSCSEIHFIFYYEEEEIAVFAINFDENKEIKRIYINNSDYRGVEDLTQFQKIVDPEKEAITFLQKIQENKTKLKTLCEEIRKLYKQNNNLVYNLKLKDQKNFLFDPKYYIF